MLFALNIPALAPQCANIMETLEDQEGCQFLKIAPSNYTINKLICGAGKRTSSLSNGDRLGQLKELRNKKLAGGVGQRIGSRNIVRRMVGLLQRSRECLQQQWIYRLEMQQ